MVEPSGSWLHQQHSPLGSSALKDCMIAPVECRQHRFLPASTNPCGVSANLGLYGLGFSELPERGLTIKDSGLIGKSVPESQNALLTPNQCLKGERSLFPSRVDEKLSTSEAFCPQQKNFLIFDRSGKEMRLIFSSLSPPLQNLTTAPTAFPTWNPQTAPAKSFGAYQFLAEGQASRVEQACNTKSSTLHEESGENELSYEGSEMREDTEEINALLYSDDDGDDDEGFDDNCDGQDEDEVSSGHSPLAMKVDCEEIQEDAKDMDDEVTSLYRSSKRQKAHNGGHTLIDSPMSGGQNLDYANVNAGDLICTPNEGVCHTVGSKRPRKDRICDTLRALESIIPGVKSKDPVIILDEAINYLKCLKYNAETMSSEDSDYSSCYGPLN